MYCKYCGRQINNNVQFCPYCGKQLVASAELKNKSKWLVGEKTIIGFAGYCY